MSRLIPQKRIRQEPPDRGFRCLHCGRADLTSRGLTLHQNSCTKYRENCNQGKLDQNNHDTYNSTGQHGTSRILLLIIDIELDVESEDEGLPALPPMPMQRKTKVVPEVGLVPDRHVSPAPLPPTSTPTATIKTVYHPSSGRRPEVRPLDATHRVLHLPPKEAFSATPWAPFQSRADMTFAAFAVVHQLSAKAVREHLRRILDEDWAGTPKITYKTYPDVKRAIDAANHYFHKVN